MPKEAFEAFKKEIKEAYPEQPVTCTDLEWCYFVKPCAQIKEDMPDLKFTFVRPDGEVQEFAVPPHSFLYDDVDSLNNLQVCHLGLIGQQYSNSEAWVLGQAFMENFYVTFDASDS